MGLCSTCNAAFCLLQLVEMHVHLSTCQHIYWAAMKLQTYGNDNHCQFQPLKYLLFRYVLGNLRAAFLQSWLENASLMSLFFFSVLEVVGLTVTLTGALQSFKYIRTPGSDRCLLARHKRGGSETSQVQEGCCMGTPFKTIPQYPLTAERYVGGRRRRSLDNLQK